MTMEQKITINVIETKEFHVAARGYNQHEVDSFLDDICDEIERMEGVIAELQNKVEMAKAVERKEMASDGFAQNAPARGASVDKIIESAIQLAQSEANEIRSAAQLEASKIIAEAQSQAAEKLGSLEDEKAALIEQIATLKASAKEYREKFAELLRIHQEALTQTADL